MNTRRTSPFTLIELLVVVAIITILAGMLLPVLGKAREKARQASCLSNQKQIGMGLMMYTDDANGFYPMAYFYMDNASSGGGYLHWSGMIRPYLEDGSKSYVCPSHDLGGWAPTCFGAAGSSSGVTFTGKTATGASDGTLTQTSYKAANDDQAPRISYCVNEVFMPRLKYTALEDRLRCVKIGQAKEPTAEILVGEYTDEFACIIDSSPSGGAGAIKSHRPTAGLTNSTGSGAYDSEAATLATEVRATTAAKAIAARAAARTAGGAAGYEHIVYNQWDIHNGTSANYFFADGHAASVDLATTLDPDAFLWGKKVYSQVNNIPVMRNDGSAPVN